MAAPRIVRPLCRAGGNLAAVKDQSTGLKVGPAGVGQDQTACRTDGQFDFMRIFQTAQTVAEPGLGDVQSLAACGRTSRPRHLDETTDALKFHLFPQRLTRLFQCSVS